MAILASSVTVTGCDDGGCTYTIKDGAEVVGSGNFTSGYNLYFTGATEPGVHNYKVNIKRGTETDKPCGGTYKVTYTGAASSSSAEPEPSSSASSLGVVEIKDVDKAHDVACGKSITVSVEQAQWNNTVLVCSGAPAGSVGGNPKTENNLVSNQVCAGYGNGGSPTTCTGEFSTECTGTLSCQISRW